MYKPVHFAHVQTKEKSEHNLELEGELVALKQVREREREQFEGQLAQLKEESRRAQDKLQVDNSVSKIYIDLRMLILD